MLLILACTLLLLLQSKCIRVGRRHQRYFFLNVQPHWSFWSEYFGKILHPQRMIYSLILTDQTFKDTWFLLETPRTSKPSMVNSRSESVSQNLATNRWGHTSGFSEIFGSKTLVLLNTLNHLWYIIFFFFFLLLWSTLNGSQLAKMKKYISYMSSPQNL